MQRLPKQRQLWRSGGRDGKGSGDHNVHDVHGGHNDDHGVDNGDHDVHSDDLVSSQLGKCHEFLVCCSIKQHFGLVSSCPLIILFRREKIQLKLIELTAIVQNYVSIIVSVMSMAVTVMSIVVVIVMIRMMMIIVMSMMSVMVWMMFVVMTMMVRVVMAMVITR